MVPYKSTECVSDEVMYVCVYLTFTLQPKAELRKLQIKVSTYIVYIVVKPLIIQKKKTKEIMSVKGSLYSDTEFC